VVERGKLGAGLVAQVLVSKYLEHTPLYRQREIYKRSRVNLPRSTLGDAVAAACHHLLPVARCIRERVFAHDILSTDDTGLRVLDPQHPQGSKRGFLWPYVAGHRWAYFAYTPSRAGAGPQEELRDYAGFVQVDGYSGYDALFRGEDCPRIEVGCMMHARRYFVRAVDAQDLRALPAVAQIRALYAVEREAKEARLDANARRALREEKARPLLGELHDWLEAMASRATPKSPLGKAIGYAQKRWGALTRYLDDGRLEIDNGEVERLIRLVALGRKNFLFAGSDAGAERAAVAYTVLATCTLGLREGRAREDRGRLAPAGARPIAPRPLGRRAPGGAPPPTSSLSPPNSAHTGLSPRPGNRGGVTHATTQLPGRLPMAHQDRSTWARESDLSAFPNRTWWNH
jgi:hypothetical protein